MTPLIANAGQAGLGAKPQAKDQTPSNTSFASLLGLSVPAAAGQPASKSLDTQSLNKTFGFPASETVASPIAQPEGPPQDLEDFDPNRPEAFQDAFQQAEPLVGWASTLADLKVQNHPAAKDAAEPIEQGTSLSAATVSLASTWAEAQIVPEVISMEPTEALLNPDKATQAPTPPQTTGQEPTPEEAAPNPLQDEAKPSAVQTQQPQAATATSTEAPMNPTLTAPNQPEVTPQRAMAGAMDPTVHIVEDTPESLVSLPNTLTMELDFIDERMLVGVGREAEGVHIDLVASDAMLSALVGGEDELRSKLASEGYDLQEFHTRNHDDEEGAQGDRTPKEQKKKPRVGSGLLNVYA